LSTQVGKIEEIIINEAKEKAENIIVKAREEAKKVLGKAEQEAKREAEEIISKKKTDAEAQARRILSEAKLEARLKILNAKEQLISEAFDKALEKLKEFSQSAQYKTALENLIKDAAIIIRGGDLEVLLPENTNVDLDLSKIAKEVEEQTGVKTSLNISKERIRSIGGVIVRSKDRLLTVDNTFEARLERLREQLRVNVANLLFKT